MFTRNTARRLGRLAINQDEPLASALKRFKAKVKTTPNARALIKAFEQGYVQRRTELAQAGLLR